MIAALFVIVIALVAIYIAVGVETSIAAHATGRGYDGTEDVNLNKAHTYLAWATSITWISIGLSLIGLVLLVIVGVFGAVVLAPEIAITSGIKSMADAAADINKNEKKSHRGFLGIQSLNEMKGIVGAVFKIFFFGVLMLMTGVGVLSLIGTIYILRSTTRSGLWNAFIATVLSFTPLILVVVLELINHNYVKNRRQEIEVKQQEITELRKEAIREGIKAKQAKTTVTPSPTASPVVNPTVVTPPPPAIVSPTVNQVVSVPSSLYSFA